MFLLETKDPRDHWGFTFQESFMYILRWFQAIFLKQQTKSIVPKPASVA